MVFLGQARAPLSSKLLKTHLLMVSWYVIFPRSNQVCSKHYIMWIQVEYKASFVALKAWDKICPPKAAFESSLGNEMK